MIETLLNGPVGRAHYNVDIDFVSVAIGSQILTDKSGNFLFTRKLVPNGVQLEDGVVEHPQLGRCYRFTGKSYFEAVGLLNLLGKNFVMHAELIGSGGFEVVMATGYYPPVGEIVPGFALSLNQFSGASSVQLFNQFAGTNFQRAFWPVTNQGQILDLEFTHGSTSILKVLTTGVQTVYTRFPYTGFGSFIIGADTSIGYPFKGYLKRLQITTFD